MRLEERSPKCCQRSNPRLYGAALRYFGSWKEAITAAGFDYNEVRKRVPPGYWSRKRIIDELMSLKEKSSSQMRTQRPDLYSAALRVFGTWRKAVEAIGIDYDTVQKGWVATDVLALRYKKREK